MPWEPEVTYIRNYLPPSHLPKETWEPIRETFVIMSSHWLCGQRSSVGGWKGLVFFFGKGRSKRCEDESKGSAGADRPASLEPEVGMVR